MTRLFLGTTGSLLLGLSLVHPMAFAAEPVDVPVDHGFMAEWMEEEARMNDAYARLMEQPVAPTEDTHASVPHRAAPENKALQMLLIYCAVIAVTGFAIRFVFVDLED